MGDQFPLFRLATLLARQVSAPVARQIKEYAKNHPRFGRAVCMRVAQAHRTVDTRCKFWALRLRQPRAVPALSDAAALDAGADILGEIIVFVLGSSIIIYEVNRQAEKKEGEKLEKRSRWVAVGLQLEELVVELQRQQRDLDRLHDVLCQAEAARRRDP